MLGAQFQEPKQAVYRCLQAPTLKSSIPQWQSAQNDKHVYAYSTEDFSSMAWIHNQVDRLLISMGWDDPAVQRAIIADTFVTYVNVYNIDVPEVDDIDL